MPVRDKRPIGDEWNVETAFSDYADIDRHLGDHSKANGVGVLLAKSRLCSFDPDDLERTRAGLAKLGIDVDAVLDSGWHVRSGKPNSARALFSLPKEVPLKWMRLRVRKPRDQWKLDPETGERYPTNQTLFELRAGSANLQDVLPPSRHPGGTTYKELTPLPSGRPLPVLGGPLRDFWRRWQKDPKAVEAELFEAFGVPLEDRVHSLTGKPGKLDFPSGARKAYNAAHSVESVLERHGYNDDGRGSYAHPGATGAAGCRLIPGKDALWYSHNAGDDLSGAPFDAFTAYVVLDHNFNQQAAEKAWYAEHPEFDPIEGDEDDDVLTAAPVAPSTAREIKLHFGYDTTGEAMEYFVEPCLPMRLAIGVYGGAGSGKSSLLATFGAYGSYGGAIPGLRTEDDGGPFMLGSTLWISSEEPRDWIVARHLKIGGTPGTIVVPNIEVLERGKDGKATRTSFDAERDLQSAIEQANTGLKLRGLPPVRLVVLDTAVALVEWDNHGKNSNSDNAVKRVMQTFTRIADETYCCVAVIGHQNKDHRAPAPEYRVAGSASWVSSTRLAMFAEKDRNVPGRRILASLRNSTGPEFAVSYRLHEVHTLQEMRTQRRADGTPVRSTLQAVESFVGMAWDDAEIARLRNSFAPVDDSADTPKPSTPTKRERAVEYIVTQVAANRACKRADVPEDIAPSSGKEWKAIEAELLSRDICGSRPGGRGDGVVYVVDI